MTDVIDIVQTQETRAMETFLSHHKNHHAKSELIEKNCIDCGCAIPTARLNAIPDCCRCIRCQERVEKC